MRISCSYFAIYIFSIKSYQLLFCSSNSFACLQNNLFTFLRTACWSFFPLHNPIVLFWVLLKLWALVVVIKIPTERAGLGSEHPYRDRIQLIILVLFFVLWWIDTVSFFFLNYSSVIGEILYLPLRVFLVIVTFCFGSYLVAKSHTAVFRESTGRSDFIDTGVNSWVRQLMYLGTLLFCLGFFISIPSLISLAVWIAFFIFYDQMANYEEKDLIRILGEKYITYQRLVPKWFPRIKLRGLIEAHADRPWLNLASKRIRFSASHNKANRIACRFQFYIP